MVYVRFVNGFLMIVLPIALAAYINKKYQSNWSLWWIGGAVFLLAQVGHIPFNYLLSVYFNKTNMVLWPHMYQIIFNALFLGLSAGIWEEGARYAAFRWWAIQSRNWRRSLQLGIGHGGFESIILGFLVVYTLIQMIALKDINLETVVPPENLLNVINAINNYWEVPWYDSFLGLIERILAFPIQIALSILVMQVFIQKKIRWVWIAVLFHTIVDAAAVLLMNFTNIYVTELVITFFSMASIFIILAFKIPETEIQEVKVLDDRAIDVIVLDKEETLDNLESTRYQ